ncbi:MAG: PP2C family protein-serine/threonine phosphatase [Bacteroidota bacterium]
MTKETRLSLYTFLAVLLAISAVGLVTVPVILSYAQQTYYRLQADVNARQAEAMTRFVENQLAAGQDGASIIEAFQATIEGTDTDRGYVCLIDQNSAQYLGHPNLGVIGMQAKPDVLFDPSFDGSTPLPWQDLLRQGESAGGLLIYGPNMPTEVVHFSAVPGTPWTISSHENASRINAELQELRNRLVLGAVVLALLLAAPASLAGRAVTRRDQRQRERQNELERQLLEAENARKSQELEEARDLQLSMLPAQMPDHPEIEVAAYMQTATEVGGDYYDFKQADDGTLTLAVGDATGHGTRAGMMVTATKSLWHAFADEPDLDHVLQRASRVLKAMHLPKLYMVLALARIRHQTLELVGAGMPPALIYRAATGEVEVVPLKGLPLGSPVVLPYRKTCHALAPGDTVMLMSDGFPELFNPANEMFGYEQAVGIFEAVAAEAPQAIVEYFKATGRAWAEGRPSDDDITFVVFKVKSPAVVA